GGPQLPDPSAVEQRPGGDEAPAAFRAEILRRVSGIARAAARGRAAAGGIAPGLAEPARRAGPRPARRAGPALPGGVARADGVFRRPARADLDLLAPRAPHGAPSHPADGLSPDAQQARAADLRPDRRRELEGRRSHGRRRCRRPTLIHFAGFFFGFFTMVA